MRIAIIGAGNVGGALGKGWARAGHVIADGVPDPSAARHRATAEAAGGAGILAVPRAVHGADAIVLALPFDAVGDVLSAAGDLTGRLLIDVTNPLRMAEAGLELSIGFDRSRPVGIMRLPTLLGARAWAHENIIRPGDSDHPAGALPSRAGGSGRL